MNIIHSIRVAFVLLSTLAVSTACLAEETRTVARIAPQSQLNITIDGTGYFQLQDSENGEMVYTRAGRFVLDANGTLAHAGASSRFNIDPPISCPSDATYLEVDEAGLVTVLRDGSSERIAVGKFQLATFQNPNGLSRLTGKRFGETPSSGKPRTGEAQAGVFGTIGSGE